MTESTVTASLATAPIGQAQLKLAESALMEILYIAEALKEQIFRLDECKAVEPLARGMLSRVQKLSEFASVCVSDNVGGRGAFEDLFYAINCRCPSDEEMPSFAA